MKISRANLQPRAMFRTSIISDRPSSKVGVMAMSANKRRKSLSVLCSSSSEEVSHSRATWHGCSGLEVKMAVCVPGWAVGCIGRTVGVTMVTVGHVTAAESDRDRDRERQRET